MVDDLLSRDFGFDAPTRHGVAAPAMTVAGECPRRSASHREKLRRARTKQQQNLRFSQQFSAIFVSAAQKSL